MLTMKQQPATAPDSIMPFQSEVDGRTIFMRDVAHVQDGFKEDKLGWRGGLQVR